MKLKTLLKSERWISIDHIYEQIIVTDVYERTQTIILNNSLSLSAERKETTILGS